MTEVTTNFPDLDTRFDEFDTAMEQIHRSQIFVVKPDEYGEMARLSHQSARELPDGVYLVDETVREILEENGWDYESLTREIIHNVSGSTDQPATEKLNLGRQNSAHKVFFGNVILHEGWQDPVEAQESLVAVKMHVEKGNFEGAFSAKPFHELANLAMLQHFGVEGAYRPVGLVQSGDKKFVLTEVKPGVRTLDDHKWFGKNGNGAEYQTMDLTELQDLHARDVELAGRVFAMFGAMHASGVFHGDAQAKNIGWVVKRPSEASQGRTALEDQSALSEIEMTLVDMENGIIFSRTGEDFIDEYYQGLTGLSEDDLTHFFASIPIKVRIPFDRGRINNTRRMEFLERNFLDRYMESFVRQRNLMFGENNTENQDLANGLRAYLRGALGKYLGLHQSKPHSSKQASGQLES
jgi:hypothetical protein